LKKTAINKATELAAVLMEKGTLIAPVKEDAGFNFREISDAKQVDLNFHNTIISPKSAFFPQTEDFVRYQTGKSILEATPVELNIKPAFLFGVRPCDVKSFEIMDIHFSGTGLVDPYWQKEEKRPLFSVMPLIWTSLPKRRNSIRRWVSAQLIPKAVISSW